jgi:Flp pilus assembly protein TadG
MITRLSRDERGASIVEMAFVAPILAALMVGMVDISRAYSARVDLEQAAQRTVEKVQISTYDANGSATDTTLKSEAEAAAGPGSNATITHWLQCGVSATQYDYDSTCPDGAAPARFFQVSITKSFKPLFTSSVFANKNADGTVTLTAKSGVRVQ